MFPAVHGFLINHLLISIYIQSLWNVLDNLRIDHGVSVHWGCWSNGRPVPPLRECPELVKREEAIWVLLVYNPKCQSLRHRSPCPGPILAPVSREVKRRQAWYQAVSPHPRYKCHKLDSLHSNWESTFNITRVTPVWQWTHAVYRSKIWPINCSRPSWKDTFTFQELGFKLPTLQHLP